MHPSQLILASGVDVTGGVTSMWDSFTAWLPKFAGFLAILAIGWVAAKVVARAVESVLHHIGFERVMDRAGMSGALENSTYDGSRLCGLIAKYIVVLLVLQLAFGVFGSNPMSTVIHGVIAWIPRGVAALAIVVVTALIARIVRDIVSSALNSLPYGRTLGNLAALCVLFLGVVAALGQAEIATAITGPVLTAVLVTVAGVIIVGVGGGMIRPMQRRWERMLGTAEREAGNVMTASRSSGSVAMPGGSSPTAARDGEEATHAAADSEVVQAAEETVRQAQRSLPPGSLSTRERALDAAADDGHGSGDGAGGGRSGGGNDEDGRGGAVPPDCTVG